MGLIEIEGMRFYAFHGHFETERITGNEFLADVSIETDCSKAAGSDNLDDALNYQKVYEIIHQEMKTSSRLLEHLANRIIDKLYSEFPGITRCRIKVSKLNPPMGGPIEKVSVTLSR